MITIRQPQQMAEDPANIIVRHYAGSLSYGTNLPTSDTDIRGIFCADEVYHRSPWFTVNEFSIPNEEDSKLYELTKFMQLVVDQNPNILESLWVDDSHILTTSPAYEYMVSKRSELLSTKVAFTFSGYAISQLKRIKGHNKWINNPQPVQSPTQSQFFSLVQNYTPRKVFKVDHDTLMTINSGHQFVHYGGEIYGIYETSSNKNLFDRQLTINIDSGIPQKTRNKVPLFVVKFNKEEYLLAKTQWKQYWDWKKNRNDSRSVLEEQFGYDTKHAMHLVRLLRMGSEILTTGQVNVLRPDAQELLDIRHGKLTYEEIVEYATDMDDKIRNIDYKQSSLRKAIDTRTATDILFTVQNHIWGER